MKRLRPLLVLLVLGGLGYGAYYYMGRPPTELTLTGIVTTNDVVVSPQVAGQIKQAESNLAAAEAQQAAATADLENAKLVFDRTRSLSSKGVDSPQALDQARTAFDAALARVDALRKQVEAQRSALALAHSM